MMINHDADQSKSVEPVALMDATLPGAKFKRVAPRPGLAQRDDFLPDELVACAACLQARPRRGQGKALARFVAGLASLT